MRLLLDTHALIWWLTDDQRLGAEPRLAMRSAAEVYVSAVSAYEVGLKHGMGKLPEARRLAEAFEEEIAAEGFIGLPISVAEAQLAGRMQNDHRDPFDRLLIAQGLLNNLTIVSNERVFDGFGVARVW
jgi:PIN domain nuclease of toxin-antitoxin system